MRIRIRIRKQKAHIGESLGIARKRRNFIPKATAKAEGYPYYFAHLQPGECFQLGLRQCGNEPYRAQLTGAGLQNAQGQRDQRTPGCERTVFASCIGGCVGGDLHAARSPIHGVHDGFGLDADARLRQFTAEDVEQVFVSMNRAKGATSFDLLLGSHPLDQPMHADSIRVRGVETGDVGQCALACVVAFGVACRLRKRAIQETQE